MSKGGDYGDKNVYFCLCRTVSNSASRHGEPGETKQAFTGVYLSANIAKRDTKRRYNETLIGDSAARAVRAEGAKKRESREGISVIPTKRANCAHKSVSKRKLIRRQEGLSRWREQVTSRELGEEETRGSRYRY